MEPRELTTSRSLLRPPAMQDVPAIVEACQDADIQKRVPIPVPYSEADAVGYVTEYCARGWESGRTCTWAIVHEGAFAGVIGLDGIADGGAELGYWMAPASRGRGLLTDAGRAVIRHGFADAPHGLGLARIGWRAYAGNVASARAAVALGFRFEGIARLGAVGRAGREDDWLAGLLATDRGAPAAWPVLT